MAQDNRIVKRQIDFSTEIVPHRKKSVRLLLIFVGTTAFIIAVLGVFLPVLPTTPFLLLSAICYGKSSSRFYNWLMNNRVFGRYIRDWQIKKCIPIKTKAMALSLLVLTIGTSVIFFVPFFPAQILISLIGVGVAFYIGQLPTCTECQSPKK